MHRTLSRALRYSCTLATLALASACGGEDDDDDGQVDALEGRLHLEVGGSGSGTVIAEGPPAFSGSCTKTSSPCEWAHDLDADGPATVTLTAVADVGSLFSGWAGNCLAVSGTPTQATVGVNSEITYDCIAEFTLRPAATCTVRFGETDWITPSWDVVVVSSDGAASQSILLVDTGGNPSGPTFGGLENPSFRKMTHAMDLPAGTSGTSRITVAQFPQGGTYSPTAVLQRFIYREDQIVSSNPDALPITWGMAVRQGGTVFLAPLGTFYAPSWHRQEVDVTSASFTAPGPDLTQPFEVGFFRSTSTATNPAAGSTVEHGIDNWQVETCQ